MDASSIVIMEKEDGILSKEVASFKLEKGLNLVFKVFMEDEILNLFLTIDKEEVSDEEFEHIYEEYDFKYFHDKGYEIEEVDGYYNPIWVIKIPFSNEHTLMESIVNEVLDYHINELERVYNEF
ncbi:DUF6762 family protein [Clostridium cylindrosporum]|uniref:Uncharacterized protein n=1 Tax=Clostridium cylindrosporum DSM 605 TaxID=1121307 RepID=A0A0J8FZ19_CLOCY|nr:DUF6762 family protein [Clostridium cylindrosporum]KMT20866.1 hypothetical protein CLCY_1c01000 [Clostridium cylindrosporum DSM 605]